MASVYRVQAPFQKRQALSTCHLKCRPRFAPCLSRVNDSTIPSKGRMYASLSTTRSALCAISLNLLMIQGPALKVLPYPSRRPRGYVVTKLAPTRTSGLTVFVADHASSPHSSCPLPPSESPHHIRPAPSVMTFQHDSGHRMIILSFLFLFLLGSTACAFPLDRLPVGSIVYWNLRYAHSLTLLNEV